MNDKAQTRNDRIPWVDIAKCIAIFAIVLGHSSTGYLKQICFSFNSVVFFLMSGMTFCRVRGEYNKRLCFDNRNYSIFFKSIFETILVPYFVWGIISILIYAVVGRFVVSEFELSESHFSILENMLGLLYGNSESGYFEWNRPLWFLPALVMVEILWFLVLKWMYSRKREKSVKWIFSICMLLSLLWMVVENTFKWNLVLPMELETAIGMFFFFGIGLLIRSIDWHKVNWMDKLLSRRKILPNFILLILCMISMGLTYLNGGTDTRSDNFSNVYLFLVNAILASFVVLGVARQIETNRLLSYIGKRTMAILVMHKFPIMFIKTLFHIEIKDTLTGYIISVIICVITIILCMIVEKPISILLPEVFGKFKRKKS